MSDTRDYNLNRWGFVDDSGALITIASSNVSIDELNSILGTINIVPNDDNYVLMVNGREAGVISITSQLKLKNVVYNPDTQSIEFTFDSDEGEKKVSVDVHELVDVYTAGQGLGVDKNQFFIKIDPSSEKYLSVSENGIKISGLDTLLKNLNETLANFGQETAKAFDQINNVLETSINTINGGIDNEIRPAITKNEESITALQEKVDGIVVPTKVSELENDAQYQNADEVDAKISAINDVLSTKVEYTDVTTSENPGRKAIVLKNHDTILGNTKNGTSVNIAMVSKWDKVDLGSAQVSINLNGKDERPTYNDEKELALLEDVQNIDLSIYATKEEFDAEVVARSEADTDLQNNLNTEAEARITKDAEIEEALEKKVEYTDVANDENPNRKAIVLKNHDAILGYDTNGSAYNVAMVSKWNKADFGSASLSINLNGKDARPTYNDDKEIALLEDVQGLGATIVLEKTNDLQYTLKVGDAIVGTIDIPKDQFVKSVSYNKESKTIDFVFETTDGEQTVNLNVSDLVDTYTAGNGISLTSNEFSLKIDATTQQYIEVSAEGLKIVNIDEKLAEKVGLVDIATEENPNRKAIVLKNHDTILGTTTEGTTQNLIMMSKWNKVDVGTASNELNLNGSAEHPTYNDERELAFVDEIPSVEGLASEEWVNAQGFLKEHQDISHLAEKADLDAEVQARKIADDEIKLKLEDKVDYSDISDGENPNRKTIQLNNHDTISGLDTSGVGYNLAMISKWNKADFGSASIPINLNGSEERPTYNDDEEIALMKDIEEIKLPTKVSELKNDAQYQTSSEVDDRIKAVVGAAPEALDTLEEIANKLSDNDDVVASLTAQIAEKATTEALNAEIETRSAKDTELQGNIEAEAQARIAKDTEIETELANKVAYTDVTTEETPNRKAIVLNNHDTLLGNTTSGRAVNIAMVSKWDKVDLGSTQVSINLNGMDERPTYNDDAELALLSDVQAITVPTKVSDLENDSLYQTKDKVDAAIATKAEQTEVDEIKAELKQFKAPYEINLNALNSAGDSDSEAISTAIGGIDKLRSVISENRSIIGDINNGTVPVSIRILGNITTVYYVLDSLAGYTLNEINIQNTGGTLAKNSVTHSVMSEEMVVDNLTSDEATLPLSAKQGKVLDEKIQKKGMYYQGVKVDTQKLFALTKESSEDDIKAALQLKTSSGSYTLPTAEILDDCLGKGYQLLSNWMPVSVAWNGAAYVLYIVGQNYMMRPTGLYTVSIKITDGVYSVFQAAKVEEFAIISKINTQIESLYQTVNDLKSNIPILSAKVELLESKVDNLEKSNSEVVEAYDGSQELNDEAKVYSISNANITNSPSITAKSVILNNSTLTNNARMQIKAGDVNINNLQVTGDFPKSTSNSVININDTENIIFKDMTFNSSDVYNGIEIGLSSDNSKLPKNIIFDNCRFEGSFSNNAILIFGTQNNATITLNNCYFEKVSNALRLSNKSNASGVTVNIINCTVDEWDSNTLWSGFLICEDYTNTESEAQAEEANLFSPEKIKVNFINLIHNSEKILPSDIVSVCGSKDENQVVVVCIDAIQGSDYCINYDANKFPTITFE